MRTTIFAGASALAALLANLSKYVLAWRGRHLLNPAAAGALLVGLTGWDATTWWVADRWLLVPVALLTLVVVVRTRRYALVGTFVAVAVLAIAVRLVVEGSTPWAAVSTALVSYPILFLGGAFLLGLAASRFLKAAGGGQNQAGRTATGYGSSYGNGYGGGYGGGTSGGYGGTYEPTGPGAGTATLDEADLAGQRGR